MPTGVTKIISPRRAGQGHGDILSAFVLACWQTKDGEPGWLKAMGAVQARGGKVFDSKRLEKHREKHGVDEHQFQVNAPMYGAGIGREWEYLHGDVPGRAVWSVGDWEPKFDPPSCERELRPHVMAWWKDIYGPGFPAR
jgi:hypothetical protein